MALTGRLSCGMLVVLLSPLLSPQVTAADSGTRFRVEVRGACGLNDTPCDDLVTGCVRSDPPTTLTVFEGEQMLHIAHTRKTSPEPIMATT